MDSVKPETKKRSFFLTSLPFFILAHATHHLLTALPQPMLPFIQQEFNLNYARSAAVTSAFSLSSAAAQLPAGWLADRIGPTILITIGVLGVAVGGMFVGLSHTYIVLLIAMVFMGLMAGGYHPASTPLISLSVPPNQRGRALGLHLIGGNSSFFLAPLIAGGIAAAWGWRGSYIALAIPTAILGVFFFIYLSRRYGKAHVEEMKRKQVEENPPQPGYKRRLIAFLTMMVIGGGAGASVNSFLSLYMVNELGASKEVAAMALSIVFSSGVWAGPIGGFISDRFGSTRVIIVTGILSGLMIFALKEVSGVGIGLWAVLWAMGFIQAIRFPVTEVFIMSQSPAKHRSTIYGVYYSTMQYTGAIFAPIMGGFIDKFGFPTMFTFSAYAVTAVAIVTSLFIWDARG
ncbi:MAG: MFS transporter [Dehalococcoidales bacterium]|jgi:FSR family fosmidomycin resistance protein-like MFS transporter|nr:MFS transporter [Dehalococcoidales bacterium]